MKKIRSLIAAILAFALVLCSAACSRFDLPTPDGFSVDEANTMTWNEVADARQYEVRILGDDGEEVLKETTRRTSFSLSELEEGDYEISVRAMGGSRNALTSDWSDALFFHKDYESGIVYTLINQNTEYAVSRVGTAEGEVTVADDYRGKPVTRIEDAAFRTSHRVTSVVVGANVRSIGERAFYNCPSLTRVELPDSVTQIGAAAFQLCSKLESVRLPAHLTAIPEFLFAYCRALETVELPSDLQTIGDSAFRNCSALTSVKLPNTVKTIAQFAFSDAPALASVEFGTGISSIGENAFFNDTALASVTFAPPAGKLTIGSYAFASCKSLPSVEIPEGTTRIMEEAFYECSALESVSLPESLTELGAFVFNGTKLYASQATEGPHAGYIYADHWLVATTEALRTELKTLEATSFEEGVVGIASNSFIGCIALTTARLPASVKYLCANAFYGNPILNRFIAAEGSELVTIGQYALANCPQLSNIQFRDGLKTIDSYAFYGCSQLRNSAYSDAIVPASVDRIGTYAFNETGLFDMPDEYGVIYAGHWVVGYSEKQSTVTLDSETVGIADYAFYEDDILEVIRGLNGVRKIGRGAFASCYSLSQIVLNSNLNRIDDYVFRNCTSLFNVEFPVRLESIGQYAFENCRSLNTVDLSDTALTTVGFAAFNGCNGMQKLILPETLEEIGAYAFYEIAIPALELPGSVRTIGERAFAMCVDLADITFGEGLLSVGDYAFRGDKSLHSVSLPDSLVSIGNYAFYDCSRLASLRFGSGLRSIGAYAFSKDTALCSLSFPAGILSIGECAFKGCTGLEEAVMPAGARTIGKNAFYGCLHLTFFSDGTSADLWSGRWNSSFCPIIWNCTFTEEGVLASVTTGDITNPYYFFGFSDPLREGYVFAGWSGNAAATEAEYPIDGLVTVPAGTVLYPVWKEAEETPPETGNQEPLPENGGADPAQ